MLNGSEVFPSASADDGFEFEFKGSGEQNLVVQFEVVSKPVGPEREFRFGVPEHPVTQLSLEADQSLKDLRLMAWRGVNRVTKTENSERIVADLGRVKFISVRGRIPAKAIDLPLRSRSCNIWNIDGAFALVSTTFDFDRLPSGGTNQVKLALPEGLVVHDMSIRLTDPSALPVGIKSWRVSNERTKDDMPVVEVDFSESISTRFRLVVQLVGNTLLQNQAKARLVRCVNSQEAEAYLAIRFLKSEEASELEAQNTSEISAEAFQKKMAPLITGETNIAPVRSAYRRGTTGEPSVSFKTWPERNTLSAEGVLNAKHSPLGMSIQGSLNLTGLGGSSYVELEGLGGIQSLAIFNNEIHSWNRVGSKAQIFLKKGQSVLNLNLVGWIPLAPKTEFVDLPSIRVKGAKTFSLKCKLTPAEGAILTPEKLVGGMVQDDARDWTWTQALGETGGIRFRWANAETPPPLNLSLSLVNGEIQTNATLFTASLDPNRTHLFTVAWPEIAANRVKANWPKEIRVTESTDKNARLWVLEIPVGVRVPQLNWTLTRPFTEQYAVPRIFSAPGTDNETRMQVENGLALNSTEKNIRWRFGDPSTIKLSKDQQTRAKIDSFEVVSIPMQNGWVHTAQLKGNSLKELTAIWPTGSEVVQKFDTTEEGFWSWRTLTTNDFLPRIQDSDNQEIERNVNWLIQLPEGVSLKSETPIGESTEGVFNRSEKYRGVIGTKPELQITHQANTTDMRMLWGVVLLVVAALVLSLRPKGLTRISHTLIALAVLISIFS